MMRHWKMIVALLLMSSMVLAVGEKTFRWQPPTQYEDNTVLPQSEIAAYDIECDGALLATVTNQPLNTDTYQASPGTFSVGTHSCRAFTVTNDGVRSAPSNTVNFTVAPGVPKAPVFAVQ